MSDLRYRRVAVIGPAEAEEKSPEFIAAERVGVLLAGYERVVTITGGLNQGIMKAASRGSAQHGGMTLGFLPGSDAEDANEWVRIVVPTGMGEARNVLVAGAAEAVIAVGGSWGTLSEIGLAGKRGVPIASILGWRIPDDVGGLVHQFDCSDEAVAWVAATIGLTRNLQ